MKTTLSPVHNSTFKDAKGVMKRSLSVTIGNLLTFHFDNAADAKKARNELERLIGAAVHVHCEERPTS